MREKTPTPFIKRKNQGGFIATEFIFALIISAGVSIVFFAMNFTMSMVEISQYIAFSTARAFAAGDLSISDQESNGRTKFNSLINNPALKPLLNKPDGGWFKLTDLELRGGIDTNFDGEYGDNSIPQTGVRFNFTPKLLNLRIALLGRTSLDGEDYGAKITGLLMREPTWNECFNGYVTTRYEHILNLDQRFKELGNKPNEYVPLEDNGC